MRFTGIATVTAIALILVATTVSAAEEGKSRLKYRSKALACTCATGLSEADINKAWKARMAQTEDAPLDNLDGHPTTRDKQRRKVDETQPR
jgi:hypothetical protein